MKSILEITSELKKGKGPFEYTNPMQIPKLSKVVVSMGDSQVVAEPKMIQQIISDLYLITGQKPMKTVAKKAISSFKLRKGVPLGAKVTLRGKEMMRFLDRLINIVLPRVRNFQTLSAKQAGNSCFNLGLEEQIAFPEIDYDKTDKVRGLNIAIVTTAANKEDTIKLMKLIGMPIQ